MNPCDSFITKEPSALGIFDSLRPHAYFGKLQNDQFQDFRLLIRNFKRAQKMNLRYRGISFNNIILSNGLFLKALIYSNILMCFQLKIVNRISHYYLFVVLLMNSVNLRKRSESHSQQ